MTGKPLVISVAADVADVAPKLASVRGDLTETASTAQKAGGKIDASFSSAADGADHVASKGAQAAGALSGLGGLAAESGGKVGAMGTAMVVAGTATQALADAGDLLNVVTESKIVKTALSTASTIANTVATTAANVATTAWTGAQWLLNAALEANPIGLVVVAVAALTAGIVLAYQKSDTFRSIVQGAFGAVTAAATALWDGVKVAFDKFGAALGTVGDAATTVHHTVDAAFDGIWTKVSSLPGKVTGLGKDMLDAGKGLADNLVNGVTSIGGQAGDIGKAIVNNVIDFLNDVLPHHIGIDKGPIHVSVPLFPELKHLANGGVTTGPTVAVIGDNPGGREAVIPLDKYDLGGGGGNTYSITVNAPVGSNPVDIGRQLVAMIAAYERAGGRRPATA